MERPDIEAIQRRVDTACAHDRPVAMAQDVYALLAYVASLEAEREWQAGLAQRWGADAEVVRVSGQLIGAN